ncbi:hypothetical protein VNO78_27570 [Psophocarpus tetragonolobus]|uniref:DUF4220 domain-containing protein n=1 Tax=Psophocarpus tetragonolobus TaxID=3891 RepID=A0AAN9XCE5_PSOTE
MVNPIPKFAKNIWSKWNIRGVILVSLTLQIILIFVAPFRKRSRRTWLVLLLWSTYLLADYTASFCVGLISNKYGDKDTPINTVNDFLLAFWTPFLLLHLGGPDTISAFALEDNQLWLRHLLGLIVQVCLTGYVFLLTLPKNTLWLPTSLVFTAGIIKFAERTRSLQLANVSNFRQSMVRDPDPGPDYAKLMEELKSRTDAGLPTEIVTMPEISDQYLDFNDLEITDQVDAPNASKELPASQPHTSANAAQDKGNPFKVKALDGSPPPQTLDYDMENDAKENEIEKLSDVEVVKGAYDYFNTYKGLVVDMIFSFQERSNSRSYLLKLTAMDALRVIEVEINFIYQAFYTKASIVTNLVGFSFRFVSVASVVAALVLFIFYHKRDCHHFDVKVTYTLLYGAVALDVVSLFMLIFSDHTFASIYSFISQKFIDSESGTEKSTVDSILSRFLKLKRPRWIEQEIKNPTWLQNSKYKILHRWVLFRRWSESMSGFNLVSYCLQRKIKWVDKVIDYIGAKEIVERWKYEKKYPMLQRLWIFIFTELERKSGDADDVETIQRICSSRGEWVIQEGDLERKDLDKLMRYVERNNVTFDECLMLWHIATDLLFYDEKASHNVQKMNEDARDKDKGDGGKKKNEDGLDLEKGVGSVDEHKENENAQDNDKGNSGDDELKKNENGQDNDKGISRDDELKKNENDRDNDKGISSDDARDKDKGDGGEKKNEDCLHLEKGVGSVEHKENENAQDNDKGNSGDDELKKNENGRDNDKGISSDEHIRKNENARDNGKRSVENKFVPKSDFKDEELRDFSKLLSDYLLYLIIMQPDMMSAVRGIAQIRFQDTCAEATNFFNKRQMMEEGERKMDEQVKRRRKEEGLSKLNTMKRATYRTVGLAKAMDKKLNQLFQYIKKVLDGIRCCRIFSREEKETEKSEEEEACKKLREVCVDHEPSDVKGDRSKSLLFDACKLATVIDSLNLKGMSKWKIIASVWVELLSYAAANCIPITHVQQLSNGGEFISLVWLLMTHLGLAKQFQIKEGHARAKLIVGEEEQIKQG